MKSAVVILALVGISLAAMEGMIDAGNKHKEDKKPGRCCMPKNYQVNIDQVAAYAFRNSSNHMMVKSVTQIGVKSEEGLVAARMMNMTTFKEIQRVVINYEEGVMYHVAPESCTKLNYSASMSDPCMPADAKYVGSAIIGGGWDTLRLNYWNFKDSADNMTFDESISFTRRCYPVSSVITGTYGSEFDFVVNVGYTDMTRWIRDRSLFDVPDSCRNQTAIDSEINQYFEHHHLPKSIFTRM